MNRNDPSAQRLVEYCVRLPQISGERQQARQDTRWVIQQFGQRREQLTQRLGNAATHEHERLALRCEIDALDAAGSVLTQLWQRRFGDALASS